jgi:predicted porin
MKKTLIALAAVAVSGAAFAQSSVTLYGVADVAVGAINTPTIVKAGVPYNSTTGAAAVPPGYALGMSNDKLQAIASNTLNNGTSRFGFKGVEDLGGGLKAGFNFEGGLSLADGSGNLSGGQLFSRAANVSLMGNFGEVRAGRSLTTSFYSVASWELTGAANYSVVANQFNFGGAGPRDSAQVMYNSPSFSGVTLSASTELKGNSVYADALKDPVSKYDLSATYAAGPVVASLAYNKVDTYGANTVLGGKYDFGSFAVAASYADVKSFGGNTASARKGYTLGATTNAGPVSLTFDMARDTKNSDTDFMLEAKYPLSKRTFVYAVYMHDGKGNLKNVDVNAYAVGVRHNF